AGHLTLTSAATPASQNGAQTGRSQSFANFGQSGSQTSSPFGALQGHAGSANQSDAALASDPNSTSSTPASSSGSGATEGRVRITADTATNSLLIFADRETYQMIESALRQLDRPAVQVSIEATIAEVSLQNGLEYGVQYFLENNRGNVSANLTSQVTTAVLARALPGANLVLGSNSSPRVVLSALSTRTNVKVLSNPSIVVLDNKVGMIQVGDQVPVATTQATLVGTTSTGINGSAIPVANNIDYRNTGIILRVLPRVTAMGNVTLEIEQEISNVVSGVGQDSLTPTISQRQIRSSVSVTSGQTVVLGGLISSAQTGGKSGIPILSSLSFIGDLFAQNKTALNRTELVIFIRPQIIADALDAQAVAEQMRSKMLYGKPFRQ
ncbi:MAG: type secretion system protein GspD, partial [Hyphomicrobiales bacterium]|nr:type secretion system protein GspD [Hyphomicrobiales bacterium]